MVDLIVDKSPKSVTKDYENASSFFFYFHKANFVLGSSQVYIISMIKAIFLH